MESDTRSPLRLKGSNSGLWQTYEAEWSTGDTLGEEEWSSEKEALNENEILIDKENNSLLFSPPTAASSARGSISSSTSQHDHVSSQREILKISEEIKSGILDYEDKLHISKKENFNFIFIFITLGSSALFFWNSILNVLYSVVIALYPEDPSITDSISASYSTLACIVAFILSVVGSQKRSYNLYGGVLLACMSIAFPCVCNFVPGKPGVIALHIIAMTAGCAEMLFQCSGYSYAVILPKTYAGWLSLGYGLCGILSFCLWEFGSLVLFPFNLNSQSTAEDYQNVQSALFFQFSICACINILSVCAFFYLHSFPVVKACVIRASKPLVRSTTTTTSSSSQRRLSNSQSRRISVSSIITNESKMSIFKNGCKNYWHIFANTWEMQMGMSLLMFLTMAAYPNIGPYMWSINDSTKIDILTGMEQLFDFTGRYLPNLVCAMSFFMIPPRILSYLNISRIILFVIFVLIRYYPTAPVLSSYGFQFVLVVALAISNGWYATLYMVYAPDGVQSTADKSRASSLCVALLVFSIAVGLWFSKIFM